MRTPKYLSNTSITLFYEDREEFYLKYLADNRAPRIKQTRPMSVGSAFDAFVKSYIVDRLLGPGKLPEFAKDVIFETQVEAHNRDWAMEAGQYVFDCYERSGALADLMIELSLAAATPRFEFTVRRTIEGIPLLGKPDIWFVTADGVNVLLDWKVNGFCSKSSVSPRPGYIKIVDGWDGRVQKHSRNHRQAHKDAQLMIVSGMTLNVATFLEDVDVKWADQTTLYGWLMGASIGQKVLTGIDQIVAKPGSPKPWLRIARHRCRVSEGYQRLLWDKIKHVWATIQSGHIFTDRSEEESQSRCGLLNDYHKAYDGDDPNEKWFQEATREHRNF